MSGLKELALSSVNKDTTKFEVIKKCHHEKKIIYYWNAETFKSKLRNDTHCCTTEKRHVPVVCSCNQLRSCSVILIPYGL
jgi:hypothetical protein